MIVFFFLFSLLICLHRLIFSVALTLCIWNKSYLLIPFIWWCFQNWWKICLMKNLCKIFKTFCSKIDFSIRFFAQLLLLLKHVCLVIFGRQSKRETNFLVLDHSPSAHNSKGWTRLKLGAWNLIEVRRVGGMDPCLSHHLLRRRMCTSRNQPSRAELRQSKVLWYWM